ncbi:Fe-S cluster assembly protein SufD [Candidatus Ishikawella capsulata]|uniref:Component of SufBCD complex n=1 Tax=Candidatus Ishikawaella capsulata Mpkobe TaxID=476281 RepID=C5WD91_9ENTR|nr:Fe-S cluster assembly protein SufD [Candidatus Ishikawaella capsulata]BAH83297.1 component of SufBCD complex [Candidatus Ishikawaella capsulata Mpkobe]
MAGSPIKNNKALQHWSYIFESRKNNHSTNAKYHWEKFRQLGLPNNKDENWKYTPLNKLYAQNFSIAPSYNLSSDQIKKFALPLDAVRLVYFNGYLQYKISDIDNDTFQIHNIPAHEDYSIPRAICSEVFLHLTESLLEEITIINLLSDRPNDVSSLYLLHITSGEDNSLNTVNYRHHLHLTGNTHIQVIEHYVSLNTIGHFTGTRFTISLGNNTRLTHIKLVCENSESYHFAHNDIILAHKSQASTISFFIGAKLLRHNTSAQLNDKSAELIINTLSLPINKEIHDSRSYVEHNKGYCSSYQLHKTITCNQARSIFNGIIKVSKHALKTDSKMLNNNLLIGTLAAVYTKPQLEIYADDIKCSHGATVGHIEYEQIFYLRARGISESFAKNIIIYGFIEDLTGMLKNNIIRKLVLERIACRVPGDKYEF